MPLKDAVNLQFRDDILTGEQGVSLDDHLDEWPAHALNPSLEHTPSPNEYHYYLSRVSYLLGHYYKYLGQLDHSINCLEEETFTPKMEQEGFDRADHLTFCVENYYIRLQSVYDRTLQLVNAVFHLGINEQNVNHTQIISNTRVKLSPIKFRLKALQKVLRPEADTRNTIIHRSGYRDTTVNMLKFWTFFPKKYSVNSTASESLTEEYFDGVYQRYLKAIETKTREFKEINENLAAVIAPLTDDLYLQYLEECKRIVSYLAPSKADETGEFITALNERKAALHNARQQ